MIGLRARFSPRTFFLSLPRRAISRNGPYDLSHSVVSRVHTKRAIAITHVCVSVGLSPILVCIIWHTHEHAYERGSARTHAHDDGVRIVLVRASIVYWWKRGGWSDVEGNGTEKGSAPRPGDLGPSLTLSPPAPLAPAALVHFLLSKIMTMLIFLTREEFFKLTCNQT